MKYLPVILGIIMAVWKQAYASTLKNTTDFFRLKVGHDLSFETYSGYEDINWYISNQTASMYYSLWQGQYLNWEDHSVPVIIWLQGGPGAASQFGCFNQVGPLYIDGDITKGFKVIQNSWGWNFMGHLLCVDQPVGVGFSFNKGTNKVDNTPIAAKHFANFLYNFFTNSPWQLGKNPLYIAGQSFAGHYIPAIAKQIMNNKTLQFNLKGVMIGDGWVDPYIQINQYDSYLFSAGIVSKKWRDNTRFMQTEAMSRIMKGAFAEAAGYTNFIIEDESVANKYYNGMNVLNYKQYDDGFINNNYADFLQRNKNQFGVSDTVNYIDGNQEMYYAFSADLSTSFRSHLEYLLQNKIQVLVYNGQNDFIVNSAGVMEYLNLLQWDQIDQWKKSQKKKWIQTNQILGWIKRYENLVFIIVRDAGHLLPSDQPKTAWYMISRFLRGNW